MGGERVTPRAHDVRHICERKERKVNEARTLPSVEELAGRIFESTVAGIDVLSIYLGDRLGYYKALQRGGPMTSAELAGKTGTHERYTREWLEQQATTQFL